MQKKCIKLILLRKIQILFKSYNGANGYLFVNGTEIIKFKAKDSEILAYSLCLGNISKDRTNNNIKKTGFNGYIHDFSTDYNAIAVSDIIDI